jgi:hypothetical protein
VTTYLNTPITGDWFLDERIFGLIHPKRLHQAEFLEKISVFAVKLRGGVLSFEKISGRDVQQGA